MRFEPKLSFFAASCWSVLVVNGAAGFFRRSRRLTSVTWKVFRDLSARENLVRFGLVADDRLLAIEQMQLRRELLLVLLEQRLDGPVLDRLERADLALSLHQEAERDSLHPPR